MTQRSTPQGGSLAGRYSLSTENITLREPPSPATSSSALFGHRLGKQLQPPLPPFSAHSGTNSNGSSAQISTISGGTDNSAYPPYMYRNASGTSVNTAQDESGQVAPSPISSSPPSPHSSVNSRGRTRPLSMAPSVSSMRSTSRTVRSTRSMTTIRGPPHSPHSHVEIVLPVPLAPQPRSAPGNYYDEARDVLSGLSNATRPTFCDPWLAVSRDNVSMSRSPSRERLVRSGSSRSESTQSLKKSGSRGRLLRSTSEHVRQSSSGRSSSPKSSPPKSHSQPVTRQPSMDQTSTTPPVPRLPSLYFGTSNSSKSIPSSIPESIPISAAPSIPTLASIPKSIPTPAPVSVSVPITSSSSIPASKSASSTAVRSIVELISDKEKIKPPVTLDFSYRESLQRHSLQRDSIQLAISKLPETKPGPCFVDDMLTSNSPAKGRRFWK